MKKILTIAAILASNAIVGYGVYAFDHPQHSAYEVYRVDGDEAPGIGGDEEHPDIALAWVAENKDHVKELHIGYAPSEITLPGIHHIEWPEEFTGVLSQTGEINSPMRFAQVGDTLKVEFMQE